MSSLIKEETEKVWGALCCTEWKYCAFGKPPVIPLTLQSALQWPWPFTYWPKK